MTAGACSSPKKITDYMYHNPKPPFWLLSQTVASLRLVSPGAATDGVTYFSPPKNLTLFWPSPSPKRWHILAVVSSPLPASQPADVVYPMFFLNLATKNFIRVSSPGWCHPGRSVPSPLVTPPMTLQVSCKIWLICLETFYSMPIGHVTAIECQMVA